MPCYITYRMYESIPTGEFNALLEAARALGLRVEVTPDGATIGTGIRNAITVTLKGNKYELSSTNTSGLRKLLQEHNVREMEKNARKRGHKTKREVNNKGQLQLRVIG